MLAVGHLPSSAQQAFTIWTKKNNTYYEEVLKLSSPIWLQHDWHDFLTSDYEVAHKTQFTSLWLHL